MKAILQSERMMKNVLLIEPTIQPVGVELLSSATNIVMAPDGDEATLIRHLAAGDISAVITRVETISRQIIQNAPGLLVIGQHGVGVDNIDVTAATEHGILVVNAPQSNYISTAEHAVMMLLALTRRLPESNEAVRSGDFQFRERFYPTEVNGKTIFIIGLGRIGSEVAKKCRLAFNMNVLAFDPFVSDREMTAKGVKKTDLEEGLKQADFVTIHVALTDKTRGLIGKKEFSRMKPSAYIINLARGPVIDQGAMTNALINNKIRGAGLDVFDPEPPSAADAICQLPNVILTPHFAGDTYEAKQRCSKSIAEEVLDVLDGRPPKFLVNPEIFDKCGTSVRWLRQLEARRGK